MNKNIEKTSRQIAARIRKSIKEQIKEGKTVITIPIASNFGWSYEKDEVTSIQWTDDYSHKMFKFNTTSESDAYTASSHIKYLVLNEMKLPKGWHSIVRTKKHYIGGFYGQEYQSVRSIVFIKPCKAFADFDKKVFRLTGKHIEIERWADVRISGKRSTVFFREFSYKALCNTYCEDLLKFVKGKKYLSVKYSTVEDTEAREYGERYETEFDGTDRTFICLQDGSGNIFSR